MRLLSNAWKHRASTSQTPSPPAKTTDTLLAKAWAQPNLTPTARKGFLLACWNTHINDANLTDGLQPYLSYFKHYEESCVHLPAALQDVTHNDFCHIVSCLLNGTRQVCEDAIVALLPTLASQNSNFARDCISFAGSAVILLNLAEWVSDETLAAFVVRLIASKSTQTDQFRLPLSFSARVFEKVAGIEIKWTRDLLSHLSVGADMSSLTIFHHLQVFHLYEQSGFKSIFPEHFLDETRSTLSLMIPADKASTSWFSEEQKRLGLDIKAGRCPYLRQEQRQVQYFQFWRDRLIIAKEVFDTSQPNDLLQFWRDKRNKVQWWTFWIAIVVFLLTLVGVVEGALQVYKAYHPSNPSK